MLKHTKKAFAGVVLLAAFVFAAAFTAFSTAEAYERHTSLWEAVSKSAAWNSVYSGLMSLLTTALVPHVWRQLFAAGGDADSEDDPPETPRDREAMRRRVAEAKDSTRVKRFVSHLKSEVSALKKTAATEHAKRVAVQRMLAAERRRADQHLAFDCALSATLWMVGTFVATGVLQTVIDNTPELQKTAASPATVFLLSMFQSVAVVASAFFASAYFTSRYVRRAHAGGVGARVCIGLLPGLIVGIVALQPVLADKVTELWGHSASTANYVLPQVGMTLFRWKLLVTFVLLPAAGLLGAAIAGRSAKAG